MLANDLPKYVYAGFSGIWIETREQEMAISEIAEVAREKNWILATWNMDSGLRVGGDAPIEGDVISAIRSVSQLGDANTPVLLVMQNLHLFSGEVGVLQALANAIWSGRQNQKFLIALAPTSQISVELQPYFVAIEHALPTRDQLDKIMQSVVIGAEGAEAPKGEVLDRSLDAACGLTRFEAEGAFSLSLSQHGTVCPEEVWQIKQAQLKKSGLLTLHRGGEKFADIGGLEGLKKFAKRALASRDVAARGILLLGVPGSGKSAIAKALGNETGRPTLNLDIGSMMGSLVGETESNMRHALATADAQEPCILFLDEVEKALSGAGGNEGDGGVSKRLFGTFLTWLNDHSSRVFVVATANNIAALPPEFARAERFDAIFFVDLPTDEQKAKIWGIYEKAYKVSGNRPKADGWTGAEIKACCRLAAMLGVSLEEASLHVVPVSRTAGESIERLKNWASNRCLDADTGGIYSNAAEVKPANNQARVIKRAGVN